MSYISFIDMVGIKASAMISNNDYANAIDHFNSALDQVSRMYECKIYGYSDNAYIEISTIDNVVSLFRNLRDMLMTNHYYFTAAIDCGSLYGKRVEFKNKKGFSMKFTSPDTVNLYLQQSRFSGIGFCLSERIISQMNKDDYCQSIFQTQPNSEKNNEYLSVFDLSYSPIIYEKLEYIIGDYLMTVVTNERASRYYLTPIISMIKCLRKEVVLSRLNEVISLISFKCIPSAFDGFHNKLEHSLLFVYALVEHVYELRENDLSVDPVSICQQIIKECGIEKSVLLMNLKNVPTAVVSNRSRRNFINVLYNMR